MRLCLHRFTAKRRRPDQETAKTPEIGVPSAIRETRFADFSIYAASYTGRDAPTRGGATGGGLWYPASRHPSVNDAELWPLGVVVKCHRLRRRIGEVPAQWRERTHGTSRFQVMKLLPAYLRWYFYAFATTYLGRSARTVQLKSVQTGT